MANSLYAKGREAFLEGSIAALSDTIKAGLWSTTYTPNLSTDQFFNIVPGGAIIAAGVALSSKTGSAGTLSAANTLFTSVSGSAAAYVGLYKDTGTSSTSPLIGLIDTASGLPVTPNGGDITVAWASGQIFTLFEDIAEKNPGRSAWDLLVAWVTGAVEFPHMPQPVGLYAPRVILHDPTPEQKERQREHLEENRRRADMIKRDWERLGGQIPILG